MSLYQGRSFSVLHPTDFSEASEIAFAHALAIASKNKADLTILHVSDDKHQEVSWRDFPSVRRTLERWGVLEAGSRKGDVEDRLGIHVQKHLSVAPNVVDAIVGLTAVDSFDLLVMSTHGHEANAILARSPSSLKVAQRAQLPTLFIPEGARSCVDLQTGQSKLNKVLLAVDHEPNAQPALVRVGTMLQNLGDDQSEVTLLYVGNKDKFPQINPPPNEKITWSRLVREGSAVSEIVRQAQEMEADMIVMVASGKRSLRDLITGSTISNVLKNSPCPVFTLPT